jgi:hypothetical protein
LTDFTVATKGAGNIACTMKGSTLVKDKKIYLTRAADDAAPPGLLDLYDSTSYDLGEADTKKLYWRRDLRSNSIQFRK